MPQQSRVKMYCMIDIFGMNQIYKVMRYLKKKKIYKQMLTTNRVFKIGEGPFNITQNKRAAINIHHLFRKWKEYNY